MNIFAQHAIRSRLKLDVADEFIDENVPFTTYEEVQEAIAKTEELMANGESALADLYKVSKSLMASKGVTYNDVEFIETVAGESILSKSIRSTLTSKPSTAYYDQVVVATEALSERLKFGIVMAVITLVIKIINWLLTSKSERSVETFREALAKIPEKVQSTDEFKKRVETCCRYPLFMEDFWMRHERDFGNGKAELDELASILVFYHNASALFYRYGVAPDFGSAKPTGKETSLMEVLYRDRGINLPKQYMDYLFSTFDVKKAQLEDLDFRAALIEIFKRNGFYCTPVNPKSKHFEELMTRWYVGEEPSKHESIFSRTGKRIYSTNAFDYFKSSDHQGHLSMLEMQLGQIQSALGDFLSLHRRGDKYPFSEDALSCTQFDANLGENITFSQKTRLRTLQEYPLGWASAMVAQRIKGSSIGIRGSGHGDDTREWFSEFIAVSGLNVHYRFSRDMGNRLVITTGDYGSPGHVGPLPPEKAMHSWTKHLPKIESTHDAVKYDISIEISNGDIITPETLRDNHSPRPFTPIHGNEATLYVPRRESLINKHDGHEIYIEPMMQDYRASDVFIFAVGAMHGITLKDLENFDPNRYNRTYKSLKKRAETILDQMKQVEKLASKIHHASKNRSTRDVGDNAFPGHFMDEQPWHLLLALFIDIADTGKIGLLPSVADMNDRTTKQFFWGALDAVGMRDKYYDLVGTASSKWSAIKDTMNQVKILAKVAGNAKDLIDEFKKSPLIGLDYEMDAPKD